MVGFQIEVEGKPVTNQKNSGQCWLYACLNTIRIPFMNAFNLSEFEFSQAHLFFWDKVNLMKILYAGFLMNS